MLTELQVKNAKPKEKYYMLRDDRGLYLRIDPSGRKYWILRYWENKKERQMSLGKWPELSLKEARSKAHEVFKNIVSYTPQMTGGDKFEDLAAEWLNTRMEDKKPSYVKTIKLRLNKFILPKIGEMRLNDISSAVVLQLCRDIEARGILETASRVKQIIGAVFRFAIASGKAENDPTVALAGALKTHQEQHMATITEPDKIALLVSQMKNYPYEVVRIAMLFSIYTFARPWKSEVLNGKRLILIIDYGKFRRKR